MNIQLTAFTSITKPEERSAAVAAPGTVSAAAVKANAAPDDTGKAKTMDGVEPTKAELKTAVDKLNQSMTAAFQDLEFSVDEDTKQTVVKLIDRNTLEVLRQMPSKEALDMAKSFDKAMGKLIDQRA
jgi:flagellar protein FlaG